MKNFSLFRNILFLLTFYRNVFAFPENIKEKSEMFAKESLNLTNTNSEFRVNFTANSSTLSDTQNEQSNFDTNKVQYLTLLVAFSIAAAIVILINARVIYIVIITSSRKDRPANILIAHLSSVVIGFTCLMYIYMLAKANTISLMTPGICKLMSYLLNSTYNIFSLNVGAIVRKLIKPDAINTSKGSAYFSIQMTWAIMIYANLPTIFMIEPDTENNKCKEILLFGSFAATTVYEFLEFFICNVVVCWYLIRSTIDVQSSIRYLQIRNTKKMRKRIKQIRFVQLQTIVFVLCWFPSGLCRFLYQLLSRLGWTKDTASYLSPFFVFSSIVFVLCPLSYVFLLEEVSITQMFAPCFLQNIVFNLLPIADNSGQDDRKEVGMIGDKSVKPREKSSTVSNSQTSVKTGGDNDTFEQMEMSVLTTVGFTGTSEYVLSSLQPNIRSEPSFYCQDSSVRSPLTASTALNQQTVPVEVYSEQNQPD